MIEDMIALNRRLAEKVMGWREYIWDDGYGGCPAWQDKNGWHCGFVKSNHYPNPWNPTQDIEQAIMVAVKIGLHVELVRYESGSWKCTITDLSFPPAHFTMKSSVHDPALAISLAADEWLKVVYNNTFVRPTPAP